MQNASNLNVSVHQKMEEQIHRKFIHEPYYRLKKCSFVKNGETRLSVELCQQQRFLLRPDEAVYMPCGMSSLGREQTDPLYEGPYNIEGSSLYFVQPKHIHKYHRRSYTNCYYRTAPITITNRHSKLQTPDD
jgi:hypothetical protein